MFAAELLKPRDGPFLAPTSFNLEFYLD